jgi:hypothetical protein
VSTTISISGSGNADVKVFGNGTVYAGNGSDSIDISGHGTIVIGSGNDTLTLGQGGVISQFGASGHDTINIGAGNATVFEQGSATITGSFGSVTMSGGEFTLTNGHVSGNAQGSHASGGSSHATAIAHKPHVGHQARTDAGHTMSGSAAHHVFESLARPSGGVQVVKNFISGHDHAYLAGHSLSFLQQHHDISIHGSSTHISMQGGGTLIELHGVHTLKTTDMGGKH